MKINCQKNVMRLAAAFALVAGAFLLCLVVLAPAHADTEFGKMGEEGAAEPAITELQAQIEESARAYEEAATRVSELEAEIAETQARVAEINEKLPAQEAASEVSLVALYKSQSHTAGLLTLIFSAENFSNALNLAGYVNRYCAAHMEVLAETVAMKAELEESQARLQADREEAAAEQERAREARDAAIAARQEAQRRAAAEAAAQLAAQQAGQEQQATDDNSNASGSADDAGGDAGNEGSGDSSSGDSGNSSGGTSGGSNSGGTSGGGITTTPGNGGLDWSADKSSFVAQWAPRINAYLAGSPLAGYGELFASSAYDYGVDPRWSPAISCVESTKGAYCFRPYNAWGWMGRSFSSWEEAIPQHVAYLARMYGGYLTPAAAQKYCPPTWEHWYNRCAEEMNKI